MIYADYSCYRDEYGGNRLDEERFPRWVREASAYLDQVTFGRAAGRAGSDPVRMACCAIADLLAQGETGRISSEMVGNWSRAYRLDEDSEGRRLYAAAARYLDGTGLLYRGGEPCSNKP